MEVEKLLDLCLKKLHYFSLNENEPALKAVIQAELEKPYGIDAETEAQIKPATDKIFRNIKENIRKKK